jgi:hypothetical protein
MRVQVVPLVWALFAVVAVEIVVTYARIPPAELYHVSGSGIGAGFGRALVFLNFPVALAALPLVALVADRLRSRLAVATALAAALLCAAVFWPGVVDEADLDARPVNALAASGVLLALLLTAQAGLLRARIRAGVGAAAFAGVLLAVGVPWLAADLGFHLDGVPVLGSIWQTGELRTQPGLSGLHTAVHLGHHHGMDGVLLALSAVALVPLVRRMRAPALREATSLYLGLQLAYGLANALQDAWLEQVVKRGWTSAEIPSVLRPAATPAWLGIALAALVFAAAIRRGPA